MQKVKVSVIIPAHNEEGAIKKVLGLFSYGRSCEVIIVDAASADRTVEFARQYPVKIIQSQKGRALQMNAGAKAASGEMLLFLHCDCLLENGSLESVSRVLSNGFIGGCLNQRIDKGGFVYRFIEAIGNIRAKLTKVFYGDQAIFVRKDAFLKLGGFPEVAIMEDVLFTKKLRKHGKTVVLPDKVIVSARRWEQNGILKTALLYSMINILFWLKVPLEKIRRIYADVR